MKRTKTIHIDESLMAWTQELMDENPKLNRTKLSQMICEKMDWKSSFGNLREADCRKEMLRLEKEDKMTFPISKRKSNTIATGGRLDIDFPIPKVSCSLSELGDIEFVLVSKGSYLAKVWRTLMDNYHYLEEVCLYGQQLRYLVRSSVYGWIGALSFSSPAWSTECRDDFIGWSKQSREIQLPYVVCNSRFLILPSVIVKNLASYILSKIAKRLPVDWENRYGVKPLLLETFVDTTLFKGTCYKASNWINVGMTKGRGRNDINKEYNKTIKEVYLYPLEKNWQYKLCRGNIRVKIVPELDWVDEEMGSLSLGDRRLKVTMRAFFANSEAPIPEISKGNTAQTKAVYRLLDNKKVEMGKVLLPHYESTMNRIKEHRVILAPQDTSELDYSTHPATKGTGPIGKYHSGLLLHDTLAFSEDGTPLGLINIQVWQRNEEDIGKYRNRKMIPIEVKESNKWLISYRSCEAIQQKYPDTKVVNIGDREADIYELFYEKYRLNAKAEILVRSEKSRYRRCTEGNVWDMVTKEPEKDQMSINIPRSGSRKARTATVSIRAKKVNLIPPVKKSKLPQIPITCVYLKEIGYNKDEVKNPLEWMLFTTIEVADEKMMLRVADWYAKRWNIETFHKTLKSGCKIEDRQLGNSERIENCLAIDLIVAWRIFHLTKLGREVPDLPCSVSFEEYEWKALVFYHTKTAPLEKPPSLKEAIMMVGKLGGHLGRKGDGMPGIKCMWKGLQKLELIVEMWLITNEFFKKEKVRGGQTYG